MEPCRVAQRSRFATLSAKSEDYVDRSFNFCRLVVELVRFVVPGPHGIECRGPQHGWSAYNLQIRNRSGLGNNGMQYHRAGDAGCFSDGRIEGFRLSSQHSSRDAG